MKLIYWKIFLPSLLVVVDVWWMHHIGATAPQAWEIHADLIRALHWPLSLKLQSWFDQLPATMTGRGSWWPLLPLFANTVVAGFVAGCLLDWRIDERSLGNRGLKDTLMHQFGNPHGLLGRFFAIVMNKANRKINHYAAQAMQIQANERILDVGFGGGVSFDLILPAIGTGWVCGLDPSSTMIKRARGKWARQLASGRLRLAQGSVDKLPFEDESFDKCMSVNSIYFWPNLKAGLHEIKRVLRPGGRLVIGMRSQKAIGPLRDWGFKAFAEGEVARDLFRAGFEKVEIEDRPDRKWPAKIITARRREDSLFRDAGDRTTDELVDELEKNLGRMLDRVF